MSLLIQISDPHFGTERPPVVEALLRLVHAQVPDLVVMSGDITQRARRRQFDAARAFVARLRAPATLVIAGNHDIALYNVAERMLAPYAAYRRAFGRDLEPAFESDSMLVLGVNTTRPYLHERGAVSASQIERVARRLERAAPAQLRVVVTHQPVCVIAPEDAHDLLIGHERAVRRWAAAGVDLVLGGHIHLPFVRALGACHAGLPRRAWAVQAGTAVSSRVRGEAGNSVNLIRTEGALPRRCVVERWDYRADADRFEPVEVDTLDCDDAAVTH